MQRSASVVYAVIVRPSVRPSVCPSVGPSNAGIVPKRLNLRSCKQCIMIAHGLKTPTKSPATGAPVG